MVYDKWYMVNDIGYNFFDIWFTISMIYGIRCKMYDIYYMIYDI